MSLILLVLYCTSGLLCLVFSLFGVFFCLFYVTSFFTLFCAVYTMKHCIYSIRV